MGLHFTSEVPEVAVTFSPVLHHKSLIISASPHFMRMQDDNW